jgi:dTDP-4-dehydrorhamnose reductase
MSSRSILLFGADGQVGWELQRSLSLLGDVVPLTLNDLDLSDCDGLRSVMHRVKPNAIVNAAAYTAVDKAETESELAYAINGKAVGIMAEFAKGAGIPVLHYSTDYVYDGSKPGRYVESDKANPQSVYGSSKLEGDAALIASGADYLILRTTWVFAARGGNFLKTILRLAKEREELKIIDDQFGAPTSAELLADVTAHLLRLKFSDQPASGLYQCTAAGETSWHGYARFIVAEALRLGLPLKATPEQILPVATEGYPLPAKRPKNSRLDCSRLERDFGLTLPHWQIHVRRTLEELIHP